jgi:hypothetical protein
MFSGRGGAGRARKIHPPASNAIRPRAKAGQDCRIRSKIRRHPLSESAALPRKPLVWNELQVMCPKITHRKSPVKLLVHCHMSFDAWGRSLPPEATSCAIVRLPMSLPAEATYFIRYFKCDGALARRRQVNGWKRPTPLYASNKKKGVTRLWRVTPGFTSRDQ